MKGTQPDERLLTADWCLPQALPFLRGKAQVLVCLSKATMGLGTSLRHLFLVLQLGECSDLGSGCRWLGRRGWLGNARWGMGQPQPQGLTPLFFHLAMLPAGTQGKTVVLGEAGDQAELPCQASQKRSMVFSWKDFSQSNILGSHGFFLHKGRWVLLPVYRREPWGMNTPVAGPSS